MLKRKCKVCRKEFFTKPSHAALGWGIYCSNNCHYQDARKGKEEKCFICGKTSYYSQQRLERCKSKKYFCGKSCQTKWRNTQYSGPKHMLWKNGRWTYRDVILRSGKAKMCNLCKTKDERVLAVHHVDENKLNFNLENLAWLCHNCHKLVHCDSVEKQKLLLVLKQGT
jgi:hypothetical protein